MWGETVDMSDLEQTVWPKLAAIDERLWSPRALTAAGATAATARMAAFRCLLNRRGVHAAPIHNANARTGPPGPGACETQR
jgi:hexosaminidase